MAKSPKLLFKKSVFSSHLRSNLRETLALVQAGDDAVQIMSSKKDQPIRVIITQEYFLDLFGRANVLAHGSSSDEAEGMECGSEEFKAAVEDVRGQAKR